MATGKIRLGSRKSPLAMAQARLAAEALSAADSGIAIEIVPVTSAGDRDQRTRLDRFSQPGVFTRALEDALVEGVIDAAVHSAKDLPSALDHRFRLFTPLEREDAHDALVARPGVFLMSLPGSARVGSCAPRRVAQIARVRGDLDFVPLRGNLQTRLDKLDRGEVDALILAAAGLKRLGLQERIAELLPYDVCLPAAGQGVIALESLSDSPCISLLESAGWRESGLCLEAERSFLRTLGAGCAAAVAAHAVLRIGELRLEGRILDLSGSRMLEGGVTAPVTDRKKATGEAAAEKDVDRKAAAENYAAEISAAGKAGTRLAGEFLERGAGELLADRADG
jgi:hydroxymethylbilane synthase